MAVISENLNIGIHLPAPTVGLIIQAVGNQRVAASIWRTDNGDGQADLVDPAYASTLYHRMVHRLVLTVGGTGIGGLATRSWARLPSR